jgi:hypothetical protein
MAGGSSLRLTRNELAASRFSGCPIFRGLRKVGLFSYIDSDKPFGVHRYSSRTDKIGNCPTLTVLDRARVFALPDSPKTSCFVRCGGRSMRHRNKEDKTRESTASVVSFARERDRLWEFLRSQQGGSHLPDGPRVGTRTKT